MLFIVLHQGVSLFCGCKGTTIFLNSQIFLLFFYKFVVFVIFLPVFLV